MRGVETRRRRNERKSEIVVEDIWIRVSVCSPDQRVEIFTLNLDERVKNDKSIGC